MSVNQIDVNAVNERTREGHDWFFFKDDPFRCCRKCGCIENPKITNGKCQGKVNVEFRK